MNYTIEIIQTKINEYFIFTNPDMIESLVTAYFQKINNDTKISGTILPLNDISIKTYGKIDSMRTNASIKNTSFPPEYVFPRNPNLTQILKPILIKDETYTDNLNGLVFELGFTGTMNVIRTKHPPYLNKKYYNYSTKTWTKPQIIFTINDSSENITDITSYFTGSIINFSGIAASITDKIIYYFDGEKIVTNYDFSNVEERKKVKITYSKLLDTIRVKAVMKTNLNTLSFYTPVIDQYTLLVDKQRVLN